MFVFAFVGTVTRGCCCHVAGGTAGFCCTGGCVCCCGKTATGCGCELPNWDFRSTEV